MELDIQVVTYILAVILCTYAYKFALENVTVKLTVMSPQSLAGSYRYISNRGVCIDKSVLGGVQVAVLDYLYS